MTVDFGAQLIGQTEKALSALLLEILNGRLSESQWVALRLAHQQDLTDANVTPIIVTLEDAGLSSDGQVTGLGKQLMDEISADIEQRTASIWRDLPPDDVAATTRVLNEVLGRSRTALATPLT